MFGNHGVANVVPVVVDVGEVHDVTFQVQTVEGDQAVDLRWERRDC